MKTHNPLSCQYLTVNIRFWLFGHNLTQHAGSTTTYVIMVRCHKIKCHPKICQTYAECTSANEDLKTAQTCDLNLQLLMFATKIGSPSVDC